MSLFNFLKGKINSAGKENASLNYDIIDQIIDEAYKKKDNYSLPAFSKLDTYNQLIEKDDEFIKNFILSSIVRLKEVKKKQANTISYGSKEYMSIEVVISLMSHLLRRKLIFTDEEILNLVNCFVNNLNKTTYLSGIPFKPLLSKIEINVRQTGLNNTLSSALKLLMIEETPYSYSEHKAINQQILYLLQGAQEISADDSDEFGKAINAFNNSIPDPELKNNWILLIKLLIDSGGKTTPTDKWIREVKSTIDKIDSESVSQKFSEWIELCIGLLKQIHKNGNHQFAYLKEVNHDILKGMIWSCGTINNPNLNTIMDEYGLVAYKKLPNVGAVSVRTGNACLYAFSILPFKDGISRLTKFRMKIKYPSILKQVDKYINAVAKREGYSKDKLEEISLPDFGIENDCIRKPIGDYIALIEIKGIYDVELQWEISGKKQSSVPTKIKSDHKDEFDSLKKLIKEISGMLPAQRDRIEQIYLLSKTWEFEEWYSAYIVHPLMNIISRGLVWHVFDEENKTQCIFIGGALRDIENNPVSWLSNNTKVQLWHPIGFTSDEVFKWREFLEKEEIKQPFKQAYRELYILTDAEINTGNYSNRFAAHILRQHQFAALCKQRGWHYTLMGNWDSHNTPFIELPTFNLRAEFYIEADWNETTTNEAGVFNYISTDQVRFYKANEQLRMEEVPAIVFTEIMRDIDLFVGVTSIGNDVSWQDSGNQQLDTYWRNYSFADLTESSKIREQVLKRLIPRLKIASQCSFDGKYLVVNGKIRTYKIHLGSGNILMTPNDQYLCIVPGRSNIKNDKVFLPFEGDNMLSIIISKALLLAEDDKIKDSTILSQINRK